MRIVLASGSIYRYKLLELAGFDVEVRHPLLDETTVTGQHLPAAEVVRAKAAQKAINVWDRNDGMIVLGADTIVDIDGEILGYPKDRDDARRMLKKLSGGHHAVYSGIHICSDYVELSFSERTMVDMYELTDEEIEHYLDYNEFLGRPGGYDISRRGSLLIERINGDYNNLLGLPVGLLLQQLRACGFHV